MENKTIAFGYSRKSPDDKEDTERSIKNQDDLIKTICKGKGWNLFKIFTDKNISGGERDRKGVSNCIKEARKYKVEFPKEFVYIIIKDQDRFARDSSFLRDTLKDLEAYGVSVFSIIKNDFLDYKDLGDSVMGLMNEQMIIQGRKKAVLTRDKKIDLKLPCVPAPFGYKYNKKKNWEVVPKQKIVVLNIISDYLNGVDYKQTLSQNKITRTKRDRIIKNSKRGLYNGLIIFKHKIKDSSGKVFRIEEIKYIGKYESILSEETFKKLQTSK